MTFAEIASMGDDSAPCKAALFPPRRAFVGVPIEPCPCSVLRKIHFAVVDENFLGGHMLKLRRLCALFGLFALACSIQAAHSTVRYGTQNSASDNSAPAQSGSGDQQGEDNHAVRNVGGSVRPPTLIYQVDPSFSEQARKAKKSGEVLVSLIVEEDGTPQQVRVVRGVGYGLDENAVNAVRQYRFEPATENGKPVRVHIQVQVRFQIFTRPAGQP
jgi:TonB family protein